MQSSYSDIQNRYEEFLKNGKNFEETQLFKEKLEKSQQD